MRGKRPMEDNQMADEEARRMGNRPDAAAALAPGHGDSGAAGAHLAGQLVGLE